MLTAADIPPRRIEEAAQRLRDLLEPTPLVPLPSWSEHGDCGPIRLKLETLQPVGSFKARGAINAVAALSDAQRLRGVYTASAGNMAQALAYAARRVGTSCVVVVPDTAPAAKVQATARLGAEIVRVPYEEWWDVVVSGRYRPLRDRAWIHPFADSEVIAGNGTIGLELIEQMPELACVYVPVGGGGLIAGIGLALRARAPHVEVRAAEVETAAALAAALRAGEPVDVAYRRTFVDGMGSRRITDAMWPLLERAVDGSAVVGVAAVAAAVRLLLADCHLVAEGAGAAALAAALAERERRPAACVVSGAGIDLAVLTGILAGDDPALAAT